jgi:hypothetical protein
MPQTVYKVDRSKAARIQEVTSDEIVSRLSITTRDSNALGVEGDCVYVLLEGREEGLARAKELFEGNQIGRALPDEKGSEIKDAIAREEDSAAEGMGTLFG